MAVASRPGAAAALPKDVALVELVAERLAFETRQCLLPGTLVSFNLVMEGHALALRLPVEECLVTEKDRRGYVYQCRFSLDDLGGPERGLIRLFIAKGRGSPRLERP